MYVLVVTDGVAPEYPPELYVSRARAELEAERWAWILSGTGWLDVKRPFGGRWVVGDRDVRMVQVSVPFDSLSDIWIAQFWSEDGVPDPEALALGSREEALAWVLEPPWGAEAEIDRVEEPWFVSGTYRLGSEEAYAVASLAKYIV